MITGISLQNTIFIILTIVIISTIVIILTISMSIVIEKRYKKFLIFSDFDF